MKKKLIAVLSAAVIGLSLVPASSTFATTNVSQASSQASKSSLPEIKTTPITKEEADVVLKAAAEKVKDLKSAEIKGIVDVDAEGMAMSFNGSAVLDIAKKAMSFESNIMGQEIKMIIKDGKMYTLSNNAWSTTKMDEKIFEELTKTVDTQAVKTETFLKYFEGGKAADGTIVFKNKEKLTSKVLADMLPEQMPGASSNAAQADAMKKQLEEAGMAADVLVVYDKDNNLKKLVISSDVKQDKTSAKFTVTLDIENINAAKEIVVPAEATKAN